MSTGERQAQPPTYPYVFYLGPFRFESEIDIPELRNVNGSGENTVSLRLGGVPENIPGAEVFGNYCQVASAEYLLNVPDTARYYVRDGREVRLEIVPGTPAANVSTYLLGSVFGVLSHQNGMLPLHASAVEHDGVVTAFLGDSGAGKSTLAACLQRRGHRIVADDICLLRPDANTGTMRVVPVAGWLKLWNQSFQHLGQTPDERDRVFSTDDKFRLYLPDQSVQGARLGRVVFLTRGEDGCEPSLEPIPAIDAVVGLMEMTYVSYVPSLAGLRSRMFRQCAHAFQHARAWRLVVPWGLERMDEVLDLLEKDLLNTTTP